MYAENILHHFKNPQNKGEIKNASCYAEESNPLCGDRLKISLKISNKGIIEDAKFTGEGCAISQSAASMLTENIKGMNVARAAKLSNQHVFDLLGVGISSARVKCAVLALVAIKTAIKKSAQ